MSAVIFDLDQTILDRQQSLVNFVTWQCRGMLRADIKDESSFIHRFIELDANGSVWKDVVYQALICEFSIQNWTVSELLSVYENCFCGFSVPKVGVAEAITEIANKQHCIGLISNGMSPFQERNFRCLGFSILFGSVIVSQAAGLRKPDSRIFLMSCRELSSSLSESIYVGDNPIADIKGAKDAGLQTIFIPSLLHPECSFADATCTDMLNLPSIVNWLTDHFV
jgi:putative hydrolase of the HAD superfamily